MQQLDLVHENLTGVLRSVIAALGGLQKVGHRLRPNKSPLDAGKWLSDCLNEGHASELHPEDVAAIRRMEREAGLSMLATYEMRDAGYRDPVPFTPEERRDALKEQIAHDLPRLLRAVEMLNETKG
jgi:hypothetical protein